MSNTKNILLAIVYFSLSIVLTGIFIANKFWLYPSVNAMCISGVIAGSKWAIQLVAAWIWLDKEKWIFIRRLGMVCLIGCCLLYTYNLIGFLALPFSGFNQFILAIAIAVGVMIAFYYRAVKKSNLSIKWFLAWVVCLAIAIGLQIKIVF